jgi:hypothetical protein
MGNVPGITSSKTRNLSEEVDSAGNYQLIDEESTREESTRELPAYLLGFRPVRSKFAENLSNGNNSRISSFKS